jgi:ammonium transporter Rh
LLVVLFLTCTSSPADDNVLTSAEYDIFRDILVMLLLGFGFLMTFLGKYGLSAVGFCMLLSVLAIQLNVFVEPLVRFLYNGKSDVEFPIPAGIASLIDGEFSAATALISFGAISGRATPVQLLVMVLFQAFFYAINKVAIVFGAWSAEDVGGKCIKSQAIQFNGSCSKLFVHATPFILLFS